MNLLFLDTETTDKLENGGRLIQLAYKRPGQKPVVAYFEPPTPISIEAMSVHHITNEMVKGHKPFCECLEKEDYVKDISESILVAHNAHFDIEILKREGVETKGYICTLKVAQNLFDLNQYKLQFLRYNFGLEIGQVRAHDAEGDIEVLEALFNYLFHFVARQNPQWGETEIINQMLEWTTKPVLLKRISFGKHEGREFKDIPKDYLQWLSGQKDLSEDLRFTIEHYLK